MSCEADSQLPSAPPEEEGEPGWTIADSLELYHVPYWGEGFFSANPKGNLTVSPIQELKSSLDIKDLVDDIQSQGISLPVLIRFSDILRTRIEKLHTCFNSARDEYSYKGRYVAVYPIKVNQQRQVVEELVRYGAPFSMGLEAGSRPELQIALAMLDNPESPIVCNGYKDEEFIRLALMGVRMGRHIHVVVEKPQELTLVLKVAAELGHRPLIGLRVRPDATGHGKWKSSGGTFSKFGLSAVEVLEAVETLQSQGMLDCLQLLHFHLGSQISNIRKFKNGLAELARFYVELRRLGCNLRYVDVGGGLGVDYDGSCSTNDSSVNYSIQEYANDVVGYLAWVCENENLPHPDIFSESGRALTAHHAMLVVNVLETSQHGQSSGRTLPETEEIREIRELAEMLGNLNFRNALAIWHETMQVKEDLQKMFELGSLNLVQRSKGERLIQKIAREIHSLAGHMSNPSPELLEAQEYLITRYYCNFSVFQSLPDHWAIDQLFPVAPIHRLHERPTEWGTLQDITCDSDGHIDRFIDWERGWKPALELHDFRKGEPYLLGVFLTGAYQEILGDLHNLFGDTNVVHVSVAEGGKGWDFCQIQAGELVRDVLRYVSYDPEELVQRVGRLTRKAVADGRISQEQGRLFLRFYVAAMNDYTYLETT
ncbi:MAG: biosynthetic arginine decarboxylase [Magnetococcales bacterium]|nr:biosynthetic arginine decarboxylase [Magnetococcales bacterium]MBF0157653.1 biosynthetic arginine decarboxylase [Magnetococcales bacterium]